MVTLIIINIDIWELILYFVLAFGKYKIFSRHMRTFICVIQYMGTFKYRHMGQNNDNTPHNLTYGNIS